MSSRNALATTHDEEPPGERPAATVPLLDVFREGTVFVWLTGSALALCILMIVGLLALVLARGLGFFWPAPLVRLDLVDGTALLGEIWSTEEIPEPDAATGSPVRRRTQLRVGNRDFYGADFRWIDDDKIRESSEPPTALTIERQEWGNFYGRLVGVRENEQVVASGEEEAWAAVRSLLPEARAAFVRARSIERFEIGALNASIEAARLGLRRIEMRGGAIDSSARKTLEKEIAEAEQQYGTLTAELQEIYAKIRSRVVVLQEIGGREKEIPLAEIVRAYRANEIGFGNKAGIYASRLWEFVSGDPRESNTEGGIFPAIFGTLMMVILMSLAVAPFGVLAAIYLREYAVEGSFVRAVRIAVNNLAGVPSIVFGVFGLGFFVYFVGGTIDQWFYPERLPTPTFGTGGILWAALTLALLTVPVVIVSTEEALAAIPREVREGSLALGATKWETIWRVLLPASLPGILTGMILAMARGAGEVAPLMITGVVKLAPTLPLDGDFPFLHLDRKFMHLGFHIYDVGFQSPNVEAAKPMVYTTTLLLLAVVLLVNVLAITVRNRLRRRHLVSAV